MAMRRREEFGFEKRPLRLRITDYGLRITDYGLRKIDKNKNVLSPKTISSTLTNLIVRNSFLPGAFKIS